MTQRSYKIHFVVTDCCRQHSWRYAANTLSCSLGMCVYILCTLFMWRCSTFGFTRGGLTREAPSETMKGIKWYMQIQMRGHTSSYYTPCSCTDRCCSDGTTMSSTPKRTLCPFQTLFWPSSERGNKKKTESKTGNFQHETKYWSHQKERVFVYLARILKRRKKREVSNKTRSPVITFQHFIR